MKKFLCIMGGIFTGILLLLAVAGSISFYSASGLKDEGRRFVDESMPAILQSWDYDTFYCHTSQEFKEELKKPESEQLFKKMWSLFHTLGPLNKIKSVNLDKLQTGFTESGKATTATYRIEANFSQGDADIILDLVKSNEQWSIVNINVSSMHVMEAALAAL